MYNEDKYEELVEDCISKKDLADTKKFISSFLKSMSSELIDLIGDLDWQFIDLKADKSNFPINC